MRAQERSIALLSFSPGRWLEKIQTLCTGIKKSIQRLQVLQSKEASFVLICITLLSSLGILPPRLKQRSIVYYIRHFNARNVLVMSGYGIFVSSPVAIYNAAVCDKEMIAVIENISLIFAYAMIVLYYISFGYRNQRFQDLLASMKDMQICGQMDNRPKSHRCFTHRVTFCSFVYACNGIFMTAVAIIGQLPNNISSSTFPFNFWFPSSLVSSYYGVLLVATVAFLFTAGVTMAVTCALIIDLLGQAVGQLRLLRHDLEGIRRSTAQDDTKWGAKGATSKIGAYKAKPLNLAMKNVRRSRTSQGHNETSLREIKSRLRRCVIHHQTIIEYMTQVENVFNLVLTHQILCTLVPAVLGFIYVTQSKGSYVKLIAYFILGGGAAWTLSIYCWLASEITNESAGVKDAVFGCDWLESSEGFKRSMCIIMSMANQPIVLKSLFAPISLKTFQETFRLSYSYYMFLITTMKKER